MLSRKKNAMKNAMRRRILDATERVIRQRGVARLRTQEIATEAGCAEGSIYRHFASKEDLLLAVILEGLPPVAAVTDEQAAGAGTIEAVLTDLVTAVLEHERRMVPIALTVMADEALHQRFREALSGSGGGPQRFTERLGRYLAAEQRLGRLRGDLDPSAAAAMVQGSCFHHALLKQLHGEELYPASAEELVAGIVRNLVGAVPP